MIPFTKYTCDGPWDVNMHDVCDNLYQQKSVVTPTMMFVFVKILTRYIELFLFGRYSTIAMMCSKQPESQIQT